jgi:uncharacterized membrane protein YphA (DoxX/SURF4 family)
MTQHLAVERIALVTRLALSAFLLYGGLMFATSAADAHAFQATGHHAIVRLAIGWIEVVAEALFMVPATVRVGAGLLLTVLAAATLIHGAMHQFRADLVIDMLVVVLLATIEGRRRVSV